MSLTFVAQPDPGLQYGKIRLPSLVASRSAGWSRWDDVRENGRDCGRNKGMAISIQTTYGRDGLRPIDIVRDGPQIVDLLRLVFGETLDSPESVLAGAGNPINDFLFRFAPSASRLSSGVVWQQDGRIVGNATLLTTRSWDRYLVANVAVHPSFRRGGIARALMNAITADVKNRGGRVILLQVVKEIDPAIRLYESLAYYPIGNMTTWFATAGRVRQIEPDYSPDLDVDVELLPKRRWQEAYTLDAGRVHPDLNWPEPLRPDAYRQTLWQGAVQFMNGQQRESWVSYGHLDELAGLVHIASEWGRSHLVSLRVDAQHAGRLERPLLAKAIRRLRYLPRRNVRIDHPEDDEATSRLLREANFSAQRTLTHMRLDLSQ